MPRLTGLILAGALLLLSGAAWASGQQALSHVASRQTQQVPPKEWAREVCTAVDDWLSRVEDAEGSIESDLEGAANLSEARDVLANFLGTLVQETDTMLGAIREAGVPKVKNGNNVARSVERGLTDTRDLLAGAQEAATNLSTTDPAQFRAAASDIEDTLTEGADEIEKTFNRAERKYKAASRALKVPQCDF